MSLTALLPFFEAAPDPSFFEDVPTSPDDPILQDCLVFSLGFQQQIAQGTNMAMPHSSSFRFNQWKHVEKISDFFFGVEMTEIFLKGNYTIDLLEIHQFFPLNPALIPQQSIWNQSPFPGALEMFLLPCLLDTHHTFGTSS